MRHLAYVHTRNRTLAETMLGAIRRALPPALRSPNVRAGGPQWKGRLIVAVGWLIALAVQAALLLVIAELIEVCHGVMELYLDLAQQQLDLTSLYVQATGPEA
jgi:hypothetical protein